MEISTNAVKELRERTGAGVMDCKRALADAGGDPKKAEEFLKQKGLAAAAKKADRAANQGVVETYIHGGGRIGAMVELNCETDFVGRTEEFRALARDLAMQVAAMNPQFVADEDVPADSDADKATAVLLNQQFIKNPSQTINDRLIDTAAKLGENVRIRRFARFELGM